MLRKVIFYMLVVSQIYLGQTQITTGQLQADYSREAIFDFSSGAFVTVHGLNERSVSPSVYINAYRELSNNKWFAVFQWTIPDNLIPDGSVITKVIINFNYINNTGNSNIQVGFYKNTKDITAANLTYSNYSEFYYLFSEATPNNPFQLNSDNLSTYEKDKLFQAIQEALPNNRLVIPISSDTGLEGYGIQIYYPTLTITYTPPQQNVTVRQKLSNGTELGQIGHWENNNWQNYSSGHTFSFGLNNTEYLQSDINTNSNEKFNNWNTTYSYLNFLSFTVENGLNSLTSYFKGVNEVNLNFSSEHTTTQYGSVELKDPWLRDDNSDSKGTRNRGTNAVWHSYSSPYQITTGGEHQGVFLGQGYENGVWNPPYYTVKAASPQSVTINGKNHNFYFQNWEASPSGSATFQNESAAETPVVFNSAGATVQAVMKGTQLSNTATAFANSSQRKVITTNNGTMYLTYESMGQVWLEKSTDNGSTWQIMNNGKPLDSDDEFAKSPSLALDYDALNNFYLVYQRYDPDFGDNIIKIAYFESGSNTPAFLNDAYGTGTNSTNVDFQPVIAKTFHNSNHILLVYKLSAADTSIPGLYYLLGHHNHNQYPQPTDISWYSFSSTHLNNTSANSSNPAIAVSASNGTPIHLVWQESSSQIRYYELDQTANNTISPTGYSTISSGSGFTKNEKPSIIVLNDNTPRVAWYGYRADKVGDGGFNKVLPKGGILETKQAVFRARQSSGSWNNRFWKFGTNVEQVNINRSDDGNYILGWSCTNDANQYITNTSYWPIQSFTTTGSGIQVANSATRPEMTAISFSNSAQPYEFNQSDPIGVVAKTTNTSSYFAREGMVLKDEGEFHFIVGDILLDNTTVDFKDISREQDITSKSELNNYLETQPIDIDNNSNLEFSVSFGVTDSVKAYNSLGENDEVNFKMEMLDNATGKVIGSYDNVTFTKSKLNRYKNLSYQVKTEGIGNRRVKLRLVVSNNFAAHFILGEIFANENILKKTTSKEISFQGTMEVKQFALTQNYPNPFNPSTIIKYQLPKEGFVTLKVYDILGREVATLVNQKQNIGRYQATFSATGGVSRIAAGVYIYRLTVRSGLNGNFTSSKKMILLK